ncbi:MAG: NAD(P)-binding protein [Alphaproteobacteria bacterium]|nr:NAD(P)-binding protein [Alphaproteobacteria bacterium]
MLIASLPHQLEAAPIMSAAPPFPHLWQPLTIGRVDVKNRVMITGHTLLYGENGLVSDRHIAYFAERARGGAGLIVIEQQAAHVSGRNYLQGCTAYDPAIVPRYAKLAEACHVHGARVFAQLFCGGAQGAGTMYIDDWRPLLAPSAVASTQFQELPAAMEPPDIRAVIDGFVGSARHCRAAGLDGVEVHAAHSQLLGAFLSPAFNRRHDGYGGGVAQRCRIVLEIGEAIRKAVGSDLAVGLRLSASEFLPKGAGITLEQTEEQVEIFSRSGLFDFFDVSGGGYFAKHVSVTPMTSDQPEGFLAPAAKRLKAVAGNRAKVFVVGRIWNLALADEIVAAGAADMVAMTRAHMADPFVVEKARSGRADAIVHCVGAMVCVRRLGEQNHVTCLVNPAMGREARWGAGTLSPVAAGAAKRVLVVGGGPAGLRAAARAAERGHSVRLIERAATLGGRLRRLAALPLRGRWQVAIDDLVKTARGAGVALELGREASAADVAAADRIVVATGATWDRSGFSAYRPERDGIPGAGQANVVDIGDAIDRALAAPESLGRRVVILDETQDALPAGLAEILGRAGVQVEILTPGLFFGDALARSYDLPAIMRRLRTVGVVVTPQHFVERIDGAVVHAYGIWDGAARAIEDVDTLVLSLSRLPVDSLWREYEGRGADIRRVGDALAPRSIEAVIYEGEKAGRDV